MSSTRTPIIPANGVGQDVSELGSGDEDLGLKSQRMAGRSNGPDSPSPSVPLPFSSTTYTPPTAKFGKTSDLRPPKDSLINGVNTIDSAGADSTDSRRLQQPRTQSIFIPLYDDSDGSDGSIVFNNQRKQMQGRERFPSFDSMASSGSLVRHAPQNRSRIPSPQERRVTQQDLTHLNPQMLPYDQRRKLMELKHQKQQIQRDRSPPQPLLSGGRYVQYITPPEFNPQLNQPPPPQLYSRLPFEYPMQPHRMPLHRMPLQVPLEAYPRPQKSRRSPHRPAQPTFDLNHPPRHSMKEPRLCRPHPYPLCQPQSHNLHSLPPRNAGAPSMERLPLSNTIDSSDQDGQLQDPRSRNSTPCSLSDPSNGTGSNNNSIGNSPPPPPPPPRVPPHHVRAESTDSVSSLGSLGSILGNHDDGDAKYTDGSRSDFLKMLNPFSSKKREPSPDELHRKNPDSVRKQVAAGSQVRQSPLPQQHHRLSVRDRPTVSRGRVPLIENDHNWDEPGSSFVGAECSDADHSSPGNASPSSQLSSRSEGADEDKVLVKREDGVKANGRTCLLPPSGQGSSEQIDRKGTYIHTDSQGSSYQRQKKRSSRRGQSQSERETIVQRNYMSSAFDHSMRSSHRKNKKKKRNSRSRRKRCPVDETDSVDDSDKQSSSSSCDYRQWTRRRAKMLDDERTRLIAQWKAEARAEALASRRQRDDEQWNRRLVQFINSHFGGLLGSAFKGLAFLEAFICNLPLTVGAIAMAIVTLGVVWFKFMEETLDSCEPVQFHSSQCTFPEFPGCFFCDVSDPFYQVAVNLHFACSGIAGVLVLSIILKMLLAAQVVLDELSSPTTASPAGLICMTTVCAFAGRGLTGQVLVSVAACVHLLLVIWFVYMALAYHIMPDPSWFPNTVGIGISAVKTWLYYPMSGHFLMAISLSLNFFFFPISLIRVALNQKISATVGFMQMSAPAISLYALTIMGQPSFEQEKPDINRFQLAHRLVYLPAMHCLFVLSFIGILASFQSLMVRWKDFQKREFSPAHAAFCFPTLSHANAIQAYRAAINSFSSDPPDTPFKLALDIYCVTVLICGTIVTLWITAKFFYNLPSWTIIDVEDEDEAPAPYETTVTLQGVIAIGESLVQPFVSPAVLQANETGALVLVSRNDEDSLQRFVRTRKVAALGFEPIMIWSEMERERDLLLEWVGKNSPRRRNRTLSLPGMYFNYGPEMGVRGLYADGGDLHLHGARAKAENNSLLYVVELPHPTPCDYFHSCVHTSLERDGKLELNSKNLTLY